MKFLSWLKGQDFEKLAQKTKRHRTAAYHWLNRRATPDYSVLLVLEKLGKGRFTIADIIKETAPRGGSK